MHLLGSSLILLAPIGIAAAQRPATGWQQVVPTGRGAFEDEWRPGQWPMGVQPLAGPTGELLMIGSANAWTSPDGITFNRVAALPAPHRLGATAVVHAGRVWHVGGEVDRVFVSMVRSSLDLRRWRVHGDGPWAGRRGASVVSWQGWLWIIGGTGSEPYRDIWRTREGSVWERMDDEAPWPAAAQASVVAHGDSLYAFVGTSWQAARAELWISGDGATWSRIVRDAPWGSRVYAGYAAFDDALWILGGVTPDGTRLNDVWRSSDGRRWDRVTAAAPWSRRAGNRAVVWRDALWLFGGKGKEEDGESGYAGDVWRLGPD